MSRTGGRRRVVGDEIVRVAAECFGEMGYRATTLDTIAARAGVSKVTLYTYVQSKEELLIRVFERTIATFRAGLAEIVRQPVPAAEKLRRILRYQVTLLASHLPFLTVFFSEEAGLPAPMARRVAREKRDYDLAIERVVREAQKQGACRSDLPPRLLVFALDGMCNWMHKWYRADGRLTPAEIADVFVALLEHGWRVPEGGADPVLAAVRRLEARIGGLERRLSGRRRRTPR
jgi:AcrR family transcriptional regulator